jgi:acyl-CoA-dependent ceramide synthase
VMTYILMPMAARLGATTDRSILRFAEQGWICIYYSCSWVLGMVSFLFITPTQHQPICIIVLFAITGAR